MEYFKCDTCENIETENDLIGIHDRFNGEIFICEECYKLYISENWPICFIDGYEQKIND